MEPTYNTYDFPPENESYAVKRTPEYGVKYARAAFYSFSRVGHKIFNNAFEDYKEMTKFAQGRQSVDNVKKMFGHIYDDESEQAEALAYIDLQVLNMASKYINLLVGKICKIDYDFDCSVIDPGSIDRQKEYEAAVKVYYKIRTWAEGAGVNLAKLFEPFGLDVPAMTDMPEEFMVNLKMGEKNAMAVNAEKAIKLVHVINEFKQSLRQAMWEIAVMGYGVTRSYLNKNNMPREEYVPGQSFICSKSLREDFSDLEYAGHLELISTHQFRREASGFLSEKKIQEIIDHYTNHTGWIFTGNFNDEVFEDGLDRIPVFRFQFLSEDTDTYVVGKSEWSGNPTVFPKGFNYMPDDEHKGKYKENGGDREIFRHTYTSKYGGTWIIDSDCCYDYRRIEGPESKLVDKKVDYQVYAPNMRDGIAVSIAAQIIEPVNMIVVAWNKIKEMLADGFVGIQEIDLAQLEKVAMGKGGKDWSPRKVFKYLKQKRILFTRRTKSPYGQPDNGALISHNNGIDLNDYFATIDMSIQMIEGITGINRLSDGSTPPERTGLGVMQMAQESTMDSLDHLFNAYHSIYKRASWAALCNVQTAISRGAKLAGAIGEFAHEYFEVNSRIHLHQFGLYLRRRPTAQEQLEFWQDVRVALQKELITWSDYAMLRQIDNIKDARWYMAVKEEKRRMQKLEEMRMVEQERQRTNVISSRERTKSELQLIGAQGETEYAIAELEGQIALLKQQMANEGGMAKADVEGRSRTRDTRIKAGAELVKQAQQNVMENKKISASKTNSAKK